VRKRRNPLRKRKKKTIPVKEESDSLATESADSPGEEQGLAPAEPGGEETGLAAVEPAGSSDDKEENEIEKLSSELEEARDLLRRKHAEFENYRKRVERERKEFVAYATSELVLEVLPVVDNLERALESSQAGQSGESGSESQIREGVAIIYRQFKDILKKAGLREVDALGEEFDPHVHEAVAQVETTEHRQGEIVDVLQKGYFLRDRLLRPAMVRVVHNPSLDEAEDVIESPEEVRAADERSKSDA
jgi:molecular chaperone GrpE